MTKQDKTEIERLQNIAAIAMENLILKLKEHVDNDTIDMMLTDAQTADQYLSSVDMDEVQI